MTIGITEPTTTKTQTYGDEAIAIDMEKYAALPDLLTTEEAAAILRCTARNVARRCTDGTFRAVKASKGWRVNKVDVLTYAKLI